MIVSGQTKRQVHRLGRESKATSAKDKGSHRWQIDFSLLREKPEMDANFWSDFFPSGLHECLNLQEHQAAAMLTYAYSFFLLKHLFCPSALQLQIPHWFTNRGTSQC